MIAARMMQSRYAVFYHEHVLNKEPGEDEKINNFSQNIFRD